jgi:hypothetical protein
MLGYSSVMGMWLSRAANELRKLAAAAFAGVHWNCPDGFEIRGRHGESSGMGMKSLDDFTGDAAYEPNGAGSWRKNGVSRVAGCKRAADGEAIGNVRFPAFPGFGGALDFIDARKTGKLDRMRTIRIPAGRDPVAGFAGWRRLAIDHYLTWFGDDAQDANCRRMPG